MFDVPSSSLQHRLSLAASLTLRPLPSDVRYQRPDPSQSLLFVSDGLRLAGGRSNEGMHFSHQVCVPGSSRLGWGAEGAQHQKGRLQTGLAIQLQSLVHLVIMVRADERRAPCQVRDSASPAAVHGLVLLPMSIMALLDTIYAIRDRASGAGKSWLGLSYRASWISGSASPVPSRQPDGNVVFAAVRRG